MDKLKQLKAWIQTDRDIRTVVLAAVDRAGEDSIDGLAVNQPAVFDELHDVIATMVEDVPISVMQRDNT